MVNVSLVEIAVSRLVILPRLKVKGPDNDGEITANTLGAGSGKPPAVRFSLLCGETMLQKPQNFTLWRTRGISPKTILNTKKI